MLELLLFSEPNCTFNNTTDGISFLRVNSKLNFHFYAKTKFFEPFQFVHKQGSLREEAEMITFTFLYYTTYLVLLQFILFCLSVLLDMKYCSDQLTSSPCPSAIFVWLILPLNLATHPERSKGYKDTRKSLLRYKG